MEPDFGPDDEEPVFPWLPPEDRLWRHPSEVPHGAPKSDPRKRDPAKGDPAKGDPRQGRAMFSIGPISGRMLTVAIVAGVIGALAASGVGILTGAFVQHTIIHSVIPPSPAVSLAYDGGSSSIDWQTVDDAIAPSVVAVSVAGASAPATGSGLLLIDLGNRNYLITDRSLVAAASAMGELGSIQVTFSSGATAKGRLVGQDPLSGLALISVPNVEGQFPTPSVGTVSELAVANPVLAVGARTVPGGSVEPAIVSGESQSVNTSGGVNVQNLIQVGGQSLPSPMTGGPLVDEHGNVVGIDVNLQPTDSTDEDLTFAVPIDEAEHVAEQLLSGEPVTHPWLGLSNSSDISSAVSRQYGLDGGVVAGSIAPNSPASRLGLQSGDIITSLNAQPISSTGMFTRVLSQCAPGRSTPITYVRDGKTINATVEVSEQPYSS